MGSTNLSISVIVPVHNGGEAFRRCLTALTQWTNNWQEHQKREAAYAGSAAGLSIQPQRLARSHTTSLNRLTDELDGWDGRGAGDVEIIVVSDGESDGSWRLAESFGVRLIRLPVSGGPAKARNIGAKSARGDVLFFVDADVEIHADTLSKVAESFEADANLAALIGSYDDLPGAPNFLSQYRNLIHHYTHQRSSLEISTFWGACGAIRRSIFEQVGGFDEGYRRPCIEDIELGYRLKYAGYQIHLRPDIQVKHLKRWTPVSMLRADIFYRALPWTDLLMQVQRTRPAFHQRFMRELNLKWSSRISVVLVFGLMLSGAIASISGGLLANWLIASWFGGIALVCGAGLLLLNLPVYRFFQQRRGWIFAAKTVPWHWLYFFYSGLVYAYASTRYRLRSG